MRCAEVFRETKETKVRVLINLDGQGEVCADTKIPFLDHMLSAMGRHGGFDLTVEADGDLDIDCHHTVEDIGIVFGQALKEAIGEGRGIVRFSHMAVPMDESIAYATLDLGGRSYLVMDGRFFGSPGDIPGDLYEHFFYSICSNAKITANLSFTGRNDHHICEALFKVFGIALGMATRVDPKKGIPSTKGTL
ncbi:imidazoleglycerol-phosphate dehydratase HisB [Methanoplanus sp. FWC-SCC4]|uniref:Imidazoleglycerol-phosphate dehydratase n=1 Tax=Methanochimaera problematica TaxID=2609417 RepID=A0AA97F9S9_9EURY|nr:imidazoleglycerol-phosphate dehydratase HisB [Methanoplanus sp. FWC-SCC4]WOF15470.1 imidazoleglycerol-phosphate dehydratase HisB [Methanoplanus sp. FWC-SCC4]